MNEARGKINLLLVDDELDFLNATSRALSRRGFEVTSVQNPAVALLLLDQKEFDVAILDVKMPGIPGDKLFAEIKKRWPQIPVILLTGHGTIRQAFETSREGVFEYLTKPCDIEKLAEVALKAVVGLRGDVSAGPISCDGESLRVLLVDDEEELLGSLSRALERRGMRVSTATNGGGALELLEEQAFDVVVLDVKMPGIGGIELLPRIKEVRPAVEVILFTGHPSVDTVTDGLREGAFDYLSKPQDIEKLVAKILKAGERSRSRADRAREEEVEGILERHKD